MLARFYEHCCRLKNEVTLLWFEMMCNGFGMLVGFIAWIAARFVGCLVGSRLSAVRL